MSLPRRLLAEGLGTALLLAIVVGSGIMGERLAQGNTAIALLANSLATGAGLFVLVTVFAPLSGAHFNPVVTLALSLRGKLRGTEAAAYIAAQLAGAIAGVLIAHAMFDLALFQWSTQARHSTGLRISEAIATTGLLLTILLAMRHRPTALPALAGAYITAAYWFTASTSFANPAVTLARGLTDTFAGIRPADTPAFVAAQIMGLGLALLLVRGLAPENEPHATSLHTRLESRPPNQMPDIGCPADSLLLNSADTRLGEKP